MASFQLDVADFETICESLKGVRGGVLSSEQVTLVKQALALYKGPFTL